METLGSKQVYANPWMAVREDAIRRPDGSSGIYGVVDSPDIALIIPADGDPLHLVEQYRYPAPAGAGNFPPEAPTSDSTSRPACSANAAGSS